MSKVSWWCIQTLWQQSSVHTFVTSPLLGIASHSLSSLAPCGGSPVCILASCPPLLLRHCSCNYTWGCGKAQGGGAQLAKPMLAALLLITHAGCCGVAQGGAPMTTPSMQLSPPHSVGACVRGPAVGRRRRALRHSQLSVSVAPCARQGDKAAAGVGGERGGKRGDGGKRGSGRAARPGAPAHGAVAGRAGRPPGGLAGAVPSSLSGTDRSAGHTLDGHTLAVAAWPLVEPHCPPRPCRLHHCRSHTCSPPIIVHVRTVKREVTELVLRAGAIGEGVMLCKKNKNQYVHAMMSSPLLFFTKKKYEQLAAIIIINNTFGRKTPTFFA